MSFRVVAPVMAGFCVLLMACPSSDDGGGGADATADVDVDSGGDSGSDTELDAETDGSPGGAPLADYGDAPDGRRLADGSFDGDGYPTLFGSDGARTLDVSAVALAGTVDAIEISVESDADDSDDPDDEPNVVRFDAPRPDIENRDDFDDGIAGAQISFGANDEPGLDLEFGVQLKDTSRGGTYYVNVLFDHNIDGAWSSVTTAFPDGSFPQAATATNLNDEWIVKNVEVELDADNPRRSVFINVPLLGAIFSSRGIANESSPYMRIALTDSPIASATWDGSGEWAVGEIEDWLITGIRDTPKLDCTAQQGAFGFPRFNFSGAGMLALPCSLDRPPRAPTGAVAYSLDFDQVVPAPPAPARVSVGCPTVGSGVVALAASVNRAALACTATDIAVTQVDPGGVRVDIVGDYDGTVATLSGKNSRVEVLLSQGVDYLDFTDDETLMDEDCSSGEDEDGDDLVDCDDPDCELDGECQVLAVEDCDNGEDDDGDDDVDCDDSDCDCGECVDLTGAEVTLVEASFATFVSGFDSALCFLDECDNPLTPNGSALINDTEFELGSTDFGIHGGDLYASWAMPSGEAIDLISHVSRDLLEVTGSTACDTDFGIDDRYEIEVPDLTAGTGRPYVYVAGMRGKTLDSIRTYEAADECGPNLDAVCDPSRDVAMHVFHADCTPSPGVVQVRVINLSPNSDTISVWFKAGFDAPTLMVADVQYGTASAYISAADFAPNFDPSDFPTVQGSWFVYADDATEEFDVYNRFPITGIGSLANLPRTGTCMSMVIGSQQTGSQDAMLVVESPTLCAPWDTERNPDTQPSCE